MPPIPEVRVIYGLLGELRIGGDSRFVDLPGGYSLNILAALLMNANRWISKAELIRAAWGNEDVREAQLHKRIGEVRELLDRVGRRDDLLTHARFGYEMRVADEDVDALLFLRMVDLARELAAGRQPEDEIDVLRRALRLWRGPHPLSNVSSDAFRVETLALEQRRKRAAVRLFDLEFARGAHDRVLDELIRIAGDHPTDRRLCEQLMVALRRCGHETDASAAYERYRSMLAEETGAEPDPLIRNLHFAIALGDETAIVVAESVIARRAGGGPVQPITRVPRQLPPDVVLVGRDDLAAEASWLLCREPGRTAPIIVISGSGGIGKTALAIRASYQSRDHYPDGQLYAELGGTAGGRVDPSEVLAHFLRALGVPSVPDTRVERLAVYRTLVAERRVLIVLDDAADGEQVSDLVPPSPGCGVLVTARRRLPDIDGAHHVAPLEPLDPVDAAALFRQVVHDSGIVLADDGAAVDEVVSLCGGLPLALRIAGSLRAHGHPRSTADLAARLAEHGPEALVYGALSVSRTIGAGFDRLDTHGRSLFLGLGLLRLPEFAVWTATALLDDTGADPAAELTQLGATFVVEPLKDRPRYRFHDLTREYAGSRARMELAAEADGVPARAYRALLTLARHAHASLYGGDFEVVHSAEPDWTAPPGMLAEIDAAPLDWWERERRNIRAAVDHCAALGLTDLCWDLAVSAHEFYTIRGYFDDWYATHTAALRACRQARDNRGEGVVLAILGQPALVASSRDGTVFGLADLERAVGLLTECHERHGLAIALRTLANALRRRGHLARPLILFTDALAHYEASHDMVGRWQTLRFIGQTHLDLRDHDEARRVLESAEAVARQLGGERLLAQTQYWIGQARLATGDIVGADDAFACVLAVYPDEVGIGHAYAAHGRGDVARCRGAYTEAEQHLGVAGVLARDGADGALEGRVWLSVAALEEARGKPSEHVAALERAAEVFARCDAPYLEARAYATLGAVRSAGGETVAADAAWAKVEALYAKTGVPAVDRIYRRPSGAAG
jgi:DNA-binding SARP family transcriptional activator/tetratricopeptide (TPR) repeat protein